MYRQSSVLITSGNFTPHFISRLSYFTLEFSSQVKKYRTGIKTYTMISYNRLLSISIYIWSIWSAFHCNGWMLFWLLFVLFTLYRGASIMFHPWIPLLLSTISYIVIFNDEIKANFLMSQLEVICPGIIKFSVKFPGKLPGKLPGSISD